MRIVADLAACQGYGECATAAPELFRLDEEADQVIVLEAEPGEDRRDRAAHAVDMCPVAALRLEG